MIAPDPKIRRFYPTPGHLLLVLLALEGILLLSEWQGWFPFNRHKGWTVLISIAAVGVFLILMGLWFITALIFRKRFQFSIRSLLILTVAVAVPCSWLAVEMKVAKEKKDTLDAIEKLGGSVTYGIPFEEPPDWLRCLLGNEFFFNVTMLGICGPQVTDAELEHIDGFSQLNDLSFTNAKITDAGLEHIKRLNQLETLDLSNTQVTDAGLEHLKGLNQLGILNLENTKVTDAGLEHFKGLNELLFLDLQHTKVTDEGVKKLQQTLPNCNIEIETPCPQPRLSRYVAMMKTSFGMPPTLLLFSILRVFGIF